MTPIVMSRREAYEKGLAKFYTGEPCLRQHYSERYVTNGACVACMNFKNPSRTKQGPRGRNAGWPTVALIFDGLDPPVTPEEMEAAFRFIEAQRWHIAAVEHLRKNPADLVRYLLPLPDKDEARMLTELDKQQRIREAIRKANSET